MKANPNVYHDHTATDYETSRVTALVTISSSTTSASISTGKRSAVELCASTASSSSSSSSLAPSSQLDPFRACGAIVAIQGNDDLDADTDLLSSSRATNTSSTIAKKDDNKSTKKQKTARNEDDIALNVDGVDTAGGGLSSTENAQTTAESKAIPMVVEKQADISEDIKSSSAVPSKIYVSAVERGTVLDLTEEKYVRDTRPLLAGCTCHACRHHTRAYIHHLIRAKEMLGEILMYGHNQHQLIRLFDVCRDMKKNIQQRNETEVVMKDVESVGEQAQKKDREEGEGDVNPIHTRAFAQWTTKILQQMHG